MATLYKLTIIGNTAPDLDDSEGGNQVEQFGREIVAGLRAHGLTVERADVFSSFTSRDIGAGPIATPDPAPLAPVGARITGERDVDLNEEADEEADAARLKRSEDTTAELGPPATQADLDALKAQFDAQAHLPGDDKTTVLV